MPQSELISFGSTFGNNICRRIADFLPLFSLLYFTPLSPTNEQSQFGGLGISSRRLDDRETDKLAIIVV